MFDAIAKAARRPEDRERLRMFQALAQTAPTTTPTTTAPTTVAGAPTQVSVADFFPSSLTGWGSTNLAHMQRIVNALNYAMFYLSKGQMNFDKFRQTNFQGDASNIPDQYLLKIVRFAKAAYLTMLMNGANTYQSPLTPQDKAARISKLTNLLMSSGIPDTIANAQLNQMIGGNLKTILINALQTIK